MGKPLRAAVGSGYGLGLSDFFEVFEPIHLPFTHRIFIRVRLKEDGGRIPIVLVIFSDGSQQTAHKGKRLCFIEVTIPDQNGGLFEQLAYEAIHFYFLCFSHNFMFWKLFGFVLSNRPPKP